MYFFVSIFKKKTNHKTIGNNLTKKLPRINSSWKKLDILPPIISKPKKFVPLKNWKIESINNINKDKINNKKYFFSL